MRDTSSAPCRNRQPHQTAPVVYGLQRRFRITHPFHPLRDHEFSLVQYRRSWRNERVEGVDEQGRHVAVPVSWTDAAAQHDPFLAVSAGRSYFRVQDLLDLTQLVQTLIADNARPAPSQPESVGDNEIMPHV